MLKKTSLKKGDYPFIIYGCIAEKGSKPFPTYTSGLARNCGMPEFIINHQAFGAENNSVIINFVYDYFIDPKNSGKLNDILNGKIVKISDKQLNPEFINMHVYCFREVSPLFEGIQQAYGKNIEELAKKYGWRFVQIWVEGDDFALEDEYYRNEDIA